MRQRLSFATQKTAVQAYEVRCKQMLPLLTSRKKWLLKWEQLAKARYNNAHQQHVGTPFRQGNRPSTCYGCTPVVCDALPHVKRTCVANALLAVAHLRI